MFRRSLRNWMRCSRKVRKLHYVDFDSRMVWYGVLKCCKGLDCTGRLFISDRAHLVFDFHQIVDGLKEVELGGSRYFLFPFSVGHDLTYAPYVVHSIGTTKKGIGPAYSAKASRSGLRVHHLFDQTTFAEKFRKLVEGRFKRYGHFEYDTEGEIVRYKVRLVPYPIFSSSLPPGTFLRSCTHTSS